ncbi:MAG TPA: hypothetical protein VKB86_11235, partial [Pyrinomonadaceae bacterium]|nr:hypothetical protein [Pyrinomonadaceae bacterium]
MSYADDIVNPLRSVMFVPGSYTWLFDRQPHDKTTKLEGVLELLQFANSYVLNDITAMGGLPNGIAWSAEREKRPFEEDDISKFLYDEFVRSDSV